MNFVASLSVAIGVLVLSTGQVIANTWLDLDEDENYTARHEASFVQAGDRFYIFGGRENPQILDTYNYLQNEWTQSASTPLPFNHFQATEYQGLVWVIGAFRNNSFPNEQPAEYVYVYDPANNIWIQGPKIPAERRRGSSGLVEYQGKFYIVGGNTIGHNGGYVAWFDMFDPETGTWTALADAPNARDHFHATVVDDKLYVAGGRLSGGPGGTFAPLIETVDVFNFTNSTWSSLPASGNLPTPRAGTSTVTFQGNVLVIGGEGNGQAYDTVEQLDPATNLWTEIASLNHARHGSQAIVSGDGVFTAVGSPNQGGGRKLNMEAFNSSLPTGDASVAGFLNSTVEELLINSSDAHTIELQQIEGNQGVIITAIELVGDNAASFAITDRPTLPALVPVNGSKTISLRALNEINGEFSSLVVTYSDGQTLEIPIRYELNEPIQTTPINLLSNGSFEDADLNDQLFRITRSFSGWQKNGNGRAEFWTNGFLGTPSQDGDNFTELDVGRNTVDSISQELITSAGQSYDLSFYLRARNNTSNASNKLRVLWNNVEVGEFTGSNDWTQEALQVVGTGFDRLTFSETSAANDGLGTHLDNIVLIESPIAELPIGDLVVNGSFEDVSLDEQSFVITSAFNGWQKNGDGAGEFWSSGFLGTPAQDGNNFTELDVGNNTVDTLSQDITTVAGETYKLSFYLISRRNTSNTSNQLSVLWNDIEVAKFTGGSSWAEVNLELVGSGLDRLTLAETSAANDGRGTHLDNISLIGALPPSAADQ